METNKDGILNGLKIGVALTGSFCTIESIFAEIIKMVEQGANVVPIVSTTVASHDTRFGKAEDILKKLVEITGNEVLASITAVEPIGPKKLFDILVIAPCTGNTLAKIANAISDTPVTLAVKAHLRNLRPVVLSISSNDAMGINMVNIGKLLPIKNIFFVPFSQDNPQEKPNSIVADVTKIIPTIIDAIELKQSQPIIKS